MSLAINTRKVYAVLLPDGKWHECRPGSFDLDSYEFVEGDDENTRITHGGGESGICAKGFTFTSEKEVICGPMTSLLAVREKV